MILQNIPSSANSHQQHVIAITRSFTRRMNVLRLNNFVLANTNNRLREQLRNEQLKNNVESTVNYIIGEIEHNETLELMMKQNEVKNVIDDIITKVENNEDNAKVMYTFMLRKLFRNTVNTVVLTLVLLIVYNLKIWCRISF